MIKKAKCIKCKKDFEYKYSASRWGRPSFCGKECRIDYARKGITFEVEL